MAQKARATIADGTMPKRHFPITADNTGFGRIPEDYLKLKAENALLKAENAVLRQKVAVMQPNFAEDITDLRDIPREKAKKEIKAFFEDHHGEAIYPSDISHALNLDYDLVREICTELEREGQIKGA